MIISIFGSEFGILALFGFVVKPFHITSLPNFIMEKAETTHEEQVSSREDENMTLEDEPSSIYQVGWRTMMAIIALSFSNNCAAIANTVCLYHPES